MRRRASRSQPRCVAVGVFPGDDDELTGRLDADALELDQITTKFFDQRFDQMIQICDLVVDVQYATG
jgi:hypothetical protein